MDKPADNVPAVDENPRHRRAARQARGAARSGQRVSERFSTRCARRRPARGIRRQRQRGAGGDTHSCGRRGAHDAQARDGQGQLRDAAGHVRPHPALRHARRRRRRDATTRSSTGTWATSSAPKARCSRRKTGELSVKCDSVRLLAKALRPLPEKFHGMTDQEQRYRQRYVDLITNPAARDVFVERSQIVQAIREFFVARGFLEVETPMMHPIPGRRGRAAVRDAPQRARHGAVPAHRAGAVPEAARRRRLREACSRSTAISATRASRRGTTPSSRCWSSTQAYADYRDLMDLTEAMLRDVAHACCGTTTLAYQGETIDLGTAVRRG